MTGGVEIITLAESRPQIVRDHSVIAGKTRG